MKKLEDIPKKDIFKAPDGYFDKLPGIIQSRVAKPERSAAYNLALLSLRVAVPLVIFTLAGLFWFDRENQDANPFETELASISTEELQFFLEYSDTDLNMLDDLDQSNLESIDLDQLEDEVYQTFEIEESDLDLLYDVFNEELN